MAKRLLGSRRYFARCGLQSEGGFLSKPFFNKSKVPRGSLAALARLIDQGELLRTACSCTEKKQWLLMPRWRTCRARGAGAWTSSGTTCGSPREAPATFTLQSIHKLSTRATIPELRIVKPPRNSLCSFMSACEPCEDVDSAVLRQGPPHRYLPRPHSGGTVQSF